MKGWLGYILKLIRYQNQREVLEALKKLTRFSYKSLQEATQSFRTRIRSDGFLDSYKGTLRDGSLVVVKIYHESYIHLDLISIISILSGIKHRNVVQLIGYCIEDDHRIIVHEFVGEFSLDQMLFNHSELERARLDWPTRASICLGVARGLQYLHNGISPRVVHRDIKPHNVVLDRSFNPKIKNFELACLLEDGVSSKEDNVAGTFGYVDPEYVLTATFSEKSDVYSFGVLLLEVICGRGSLNVFRYCEQNSVDLVTKLRERGRSLEIVDPTLGQYPEDEVIRFISVALFCTQESSDLRPSMFEVWLMLSGGYDFSKKVLGVPWHCQSSSNEDEYKGPAHGNLIEI